MNIVLWFLIAFLSGALPFSVWLGMALKGSDVRQVGDGNPGATNALKLGGWRLGLLVLLLDVTKGAIPVGVAYQILGYQGPGMVLIGLSPLLGHVFSPFLNFNGGKGLAVTLGVWIGLTIYSVPLVSILSLTFFYLFITLEGWTVLLTILTMAAYLLAFLPDSVLLAVLALQALLILWKHRADLGKKPAIHPKWLKKQPHHGNEHVAR